MKTFVNKVATNNDQVTTVYFAQAESAPTEFGEWAECNESDLAAAKYNNHLFTQAGVRYFGKL